MGNIKCYETAPNLALSLHWQKKETGRMGRIMKGMVAVTAVELVFTIAVLLCSPGGCPTVSDRCSQCQAPNNRGSWRERGL